MSEIIKSIAIENTGADDWQIYMVCCTEVICNEVAQGLTQKDIALSYAMAIRSAANGVERPDWGKINGAILAKWKMSGLERIKKRAMDIARGTIAP
jgi:hypothetical protein